MDHEDIFLTEFNLMWSKEAKGHNQISPFRKVKHLCYFILLKFLTAD